MPNTIHCPHCHHEIQVGDALDLAVRDRLLLERPRLQQEALSQARATITVELHDLQQQLDQSRAQLDLAREKEMLLRKERRGLEDRQHELELATQRTLDEERLKIREEAQRQADEEHRLKEADRDKLIGDLRLQIAELKRKAEQGVPGIQGEVMELELEELLRTLFPADDIEPVPVGVHGGDLMQYVRDATGRRCGTILWESKRTKKWNEAWLPKLRDDQRLAGADVAVIATAELPKRMTTLDCIDGIWVARWNCVPGLTAALRAGILEVERTRRSFDGRQTKADHLISYLCGPGFRQKVEGIVEAYQTIRDDLDSEKGYHHRMWSRREKQLQRALLTTESFMGDLGGILDASLPRIDRLATALIAVEESDMPLEEPAPF